VTVSNIFSDASPPALTPSNDALSVNLGLAFYVIAVSGYSVTGLRFYIPAGTTGLPADGHLGYVYGSTGSPPAASGSPLATCTFIAVTAGGWNTAALNTAVPLTPGAVYWGVVFFPAGLYGALDGVMVGSAVQSVENPNLYAANRYEVSPGNCSWRYGAAGQLPTEGGASNWYGLDVLVDDGAGSPTDLADPVGISDTATGVRTGLPSTVTATGTATDTLGATGTDAAALTVGPGGGVRTVPATLLGNRLAFGSAIDGTRPQAPEFAAEPAGALTLGIQFTALRDLRITGARIYKAPLAAGTVPVTLWTSAGAKLAETTVTWTSDAGGWRQITFPAAAAIAKNSDYMVSYFSPNGQFAVTPWAYNAQPTIVYPFYIVDFQGGGTPSAYRINPAAGFPNTRTAYSYWIDVLGEWDDLMPGYESGSSYFDQWRNGASSFAFPVGVFNADPEFLVDYMKVGVNTNIAAPATPEHIEQIKASGMDHIADAQLFDLTAAFVAAEDPDYADRLKGYFIADEPDLIDPPDIGFRSPTLLRTWIDAVRAVDTTRPCVLNLGKVPPLAQGFYYKPLGSTLLAASQYWRDWVALSDVASCDFYNMTSDQDEGRFGIWTYPRITGVMRALADGTKPVWGYVETTSQMPGEPTANQVYRATWAHLIAGATGIVFFDHRFAGSGVTQDFAALLHDPAMRSRVQSLATELQSLAPALLAPEAGLVTAVGSSGTLATGIGGLAAGTPIPIHYVTRIVGSTRYLFAQAIRPGATTGTFTAPTAGGQTVQVIDEGRTLTADGSGVFTDAFTGDYQVHLYSWVQGGGVAPANTVAPVVSGTAVLGGTLTSTPGTWTGTAPITITYRWRRNATNISGAPAGPTYVIQAADIGQAITCAVSGANASGALTVNSNTITPAASSGGTLTHDTAFVGPDYYTRFANGPSSSLSYFPLLVYHLYPPQWTPDMRNRMAAAHLNAVYMAYDHTDQAAITELFTVGMRMFLNGTVSGRVNENAVTMGYTMYDEPNQGGSDYAESAGTPANDTGAALYIADANAYRAADPTRPVIGNFTKDVYEWSFPAPGWSNAQHETHMRKMLTALDITSADNYGWTDIWEWGAAGQGNPSSTGHVGAWMYGHTIDRLRFYNPAAPAYGFVDAVAAWPQDGGAPLGSATPTMIETAVWNVLVHDGRGITFWPRDFYHDDDDPYPGATFTEPYSLFADHQWDAHYAKVQSLCAQILAIAPQLNSPTVLGCSATGTSGVPVSALGKDVGGKLWLLVQADGNATHPMSNTATMTATITVPSSIPVGTVLTVVGESRTVTVNASHQFTDTFATTTETPQYAPRSMTYGYAHHIYAQP
jgi:hypothetical protein